MATQLQQHQQPRSAFTTQAAYFEHLLAVGIPVDAVPPEFRADYDAHISELCASASSTSSLVSNATPSRAASFSLTYGAGAVAPSPTASNLSALAAAELPRDFTSVRRQDLVAAKYLDRQAEWRAAQALQVARAHAQAMSLAHAQAQAQAQAQALVEQQPSVQSTVNVDDGGFNNNNKTRKKKKPKKKKINTEKTDPAPPELADASLAPTTSTHIPSHHDTHDGGRKSNITVPLPGSLPLLPVGRQSSDAQPTATATVTAPPATSPGAEYMIHARRYVSSMRVATRSHSQMAAVLLGVAERLVRQQQEQFVDDSDDEAAEDDDEDEYSGDDNESSEGQDGDEASIGDEEEGEYGDGELQLRSGQTTPTPTGRTNRPSPLPTQVMLHTLATVPERSPAPPSPSSFAAGPSRTALATPTGTTTAAMTPATATEQVNDWRFGRENWGQRSRLKKPKENKKSMGKKVAKAGVETGTDVGVGRGTVDQ